MLPPAPRGFRLVRVLRYGVATVTSELLRGDESFFGKRLVPRARGDEEARRALVDEARILAALDGRGTARFVDAGEDGDGPYIVCALLPWPSLAAIPRPSSERFAELTEQAFSCLAEVHEASDEHGALGVVHGDVTPENVLVDGECKNVALVDFGLSRWRGSPVEGGAAFRGTLRFAAPEVARGGLPNARSDVFSLALTLLSVRSGVPPRDAPNEAALLVRAADERVDAFVDMATRGLSTPLADALQRCAAFDPTGRPASAREALR